MKKVSIRVWSLLVTMCVLVTAFVGCGNGDTQSNNSQESKQESSQESEASSENSEESSGTTSNLNETQELVLGSVRDIIPGDGDAYYVSMSADVWEPLTRDVEGAIEPGLAKS